MSEDNDVLSPCPISVCLCFVIFFHQIDCFSSNGCNGYKSSLKIILEWEICTNAVFMYEAHVGPLRKATIIWYFTSTLLHAAEICFYLSCYCIMYFQAVVLYSNHGESQDKSSLYASFFVLCSKMLMSPMDSSTATVCLWSLTGQFSVNYTFQAV